MRSDFLPSYPIINALMCCDICNKEGEPFTLKMCPHCRFAHYCDDDCQKVHRQIHKCHQDAEKLKERNEWLERNRNKENTDNDDDIVDELLFQAIPPKEDCPICFRPFSIDLIGKIYKECCGKLICAGCHMEDIHATIEREQSQHQGPRQGPRCPFCRAPHSSSVSEYIIRLEKRMERNDSEAIYIVSIYYSKGIYGLPMDLQKALDLCLRAADLGYSKACYVLALCYEKGVGLPKDIAKAKEYYEKAAKKGNIMARHNLGEDEWKKGNYYTAGRHWLISAAAGDALSLVKIAEFYRYQYVTKEEYVTALTSYIQVQHDEDSMERKRAAAAAPR